MKHLALAALAAVTLGACANMTPDQQAQAVTLCAGAKVALAVAANHDVDADTLASTPRTHGRNIPPWPAPPSPAWMP